MWPKIYNRLQYIVKDAKRHSVWQEEGQIEGEKERKEERRCCLSSCCYCGGLTKGVNAA